MNEHVTAVHAICRALVASKPMRAPWSRGPPAASVSTMKESTRIVGLKRCPRDNGVCYRFSITDSQGMRRIVASVEA